MSYWGVAEAIQFQAIDTAANGVGKTGDNANFTLKWVKDGVVQSLTGSPSISEVDATNCPGLYTVTVAAADMQCIRGTLHGKSSTSGVQIIKVDVSPLRLPNAAPGASGGLPTTDASNAVKVQSGTGANQIDLSSGLVKLQATTHTGAIIPSVTTTGTVTNPVTAGTVSDKTGYSLVATGLDLVTLSEPGSVPNFSTGTIRTWMAWMAALSSNKMTQTTTTSTLRNRADSANIATASVSDDGVTFTRGLWA